MSKPLTPPTWPSRSSRPLWWWEICQSPRTSDEHRSLYDRRMERRAWTWVRTTWLRRAVVPRSSSQLRWRPRDRRLPKGRRWQRSRWGRCQCHDGWLTTCWWAEVCRWSSEVRDYAASVHFSARNSRRSRLALARPSVRRSGLHSFACCAARDCWSRLGCRAF